MCIRDRIKGKLADLIAQDPKVLEEMDGQDRAVANQSRYISNFGKYPVYRNTDVEFYGDASDGLEAQKKALSEAKTFIFMEYHAIEDSTSFTAVSYTHLDVYKRQRRRRSPR